jgi:metallo-beta-lactamase class B
MKKIMMFILIVLIQPVGYSQNGYERIKVSDNIELIKISDNAWVHVSYSFFPGYGRIPANGLIYIEGNDAFLFDTPVSDSLTRELVSWLKEKMEIKITGFVPNHWHNDCMGGLGFLQHQNIESYANQMTIDIARSKNLPVPLHGFKDSLQLHLNGKAIDCFYFGSAHTVDNIAVWIPSEQILFAGCMIKSQDAQDLGNTADGDLAAYPKTIDKLKKKFPYAKIVIPGHGPFGGKELIDHTRTLSEIYRR